ncbi:MAG: phosphatase PAP2 family protein [Armatimonas sp.]
MRDAVFGIIVCLAGAPAAFAQSSDPPEKPALMRFASGNGNVAFLAVGVALPYLRDDKERSVHILDALATGLVTSQLLKMTFRERRPDGSSHDSFPSGHATAAFAIAAMQPARERPYWYAGATLIGISRVVLDRHYVHDVVAGAALGIYAAQEAKRHPNGLILRPILSQHGTGLLITQAL